MTNNLTIDFDYDRIIVDKWSYDSILHTMNLNTVNQTNDLITYSGYPIYITSGKNIVCDNSLEQDTWVFTLRDEVVRIWIKKLSLLEKGK